jgi:hypothetical protein
MQMDNLPFTMRKNVSSVFDSMIMEEKRWPFPLGLRGMPNLRSAALSYLNK